MDDRRKVLIIDDEIDLCLLLKGYFLRKDFDVYLGHNLKEATELLATIKPDILFLDNNLSDGVGWKAAPGFAAQNPSMFIYLISAFHPKVPEMPSSNYKVIEKPFSLNEIERQLADIQPAKNP